MGEVFRKRSFKGEIFSLFPTPFYTSSRIYFDEDLEETGLGGVLDGISEEKARIILDHARNLSSIKPELAFYFLFHHSWLLQAFSDEELSQWIRVLLDIYDSQGLNPAKEFILRGGSHPAFLKRWGKGLSFEQIYGILHNYLHALGREEIGLQEGKTAHTDLTTIYLPQRIGFFAERDLNFLVYKVMVTSLYAQVRLGTYHLSLKKIGPLEAALRQRHGRKDLPHLISDLSRFLALFPDPALAGDLFRVLENMRVERWMAQALPGLFRRLEALKGKLALKRKPISALSPRNQLMEALVHWSLTGEPPHMGDPSLENLAEQCRDMLLVAGSEGATVEEVAELVAVLYDLLDALPNLYEPVEMPPHMGELQPEEAERGRRRKRESTRVNFRTELAKLVQELPDCQEVRIELPALERESPGKKTPQQQQVPDHLLADGNPLPLPEALRKIIEEIYEDLGSIPASYLAVADDMSGHFFRPLCQMPEGTGYFLSEHGEGVHVLDEWDYRRQGYRKRWALLVEKEAPPSGDLDFVTETLTRYQGVIRRIKKQFERIRMEDRLVRRQREGDGVDLDAVVEAFSDHRAGLHPSERVFVRLRRDRRDITAIFLIDLSGSTSGWINEMERAGLLILGEAMEVLKDRFAVYGFSGQTRKRCELFRIKGFDEPYGEGVKRRIANLRALEYTRLGPPIRHLSKLLARMESRTKLLITLSDGKPDDYDGYGGDYGIEDTRQALVEAKNLGIHPFCITIDKAEHSYLSHMYGAGHYTFIDDLSRLPLKVPEIYRKLTT